MSVAIVVPKEYGYVVITTAATFILGFWSGMRTVAFRKPTGLKHPVDMADSAQLSAASAEQKHKLYLYNCAQRAHANFLEYQPSVALSLLVAGLAYPIASASLGGVWIVGRVLYAVGYTNPNKEGGRGRATGFMTAALPQLGLWGLTVWSGVQMVL